MATPGAAPSRPESPAPVPAPQRLVGELVVHVEQRRRIAEQHVVVEQQQPVEAARLRQQFVVASGEVVAQAADHPDAGGGVDRVVGGQHVRMIPEPVSPRSSSKPKPRLEQGTGAGEALQQRLDEVGSIQGEDGHRKPRPIDRFGPGGRVQTDRLGAREVVGVGVPVQRGGGIRHDDQANGPASSSRRWSWRRVTGGFVPAPGGPRALACACG